MATIPSITIPDTQIQRVIDAFAAEFGYQSTITNADGTTSPNPVTKAQFAKQQLIAYIKQITRNYEANQAAATARQSKETEVNNIQIS